MLVDLAFLPPANEVDGRLCFYRCVCFCSQWGRACVIAAGVCVVAWGACMVAGGFMVDGGCAWLWGGMHGCWGCMVGRMCMVVGGMHGCQGACVVAGGCTWLPGGMCGCQRGVHGCWGLCMVAGGWHVWLHGRHAWLLGGAWFGGYVWLLGDMHGCRGHAWLLGGVHGCRAAYVVAGGHAWLLGGACVGYDKIRSMSGRYASYWNAFLLRFSFTFVFLFYCTYLELSDLVIHNN